MKHTEFDELFDDVSNWGHWSQSSELGALNHITPQKIADAGRTITQGVSVTLSHRLDTTEAIDNPSPAEHRMTVVPDHTATGLEFACDYVGLEMHGEAHSHIDALCHVSYRGRLFNDVPVDVIDTKGAGALTMDAVRNGITTRGVLLDIPRLRGTSWLEPGEAVRPEEIEQAEREHGVRLEEGDVLLLRTGHHRRRAELGPWDASEAKAGLHPSAMRLLHSRKISALGSDGDGDAIPSQVEGVSHPIHVLGITAMGLHFFDSLNLEPLAAQCEELQRWEFFFVATPLRLVGGTGSPVNPVAIF